MLPLVPNRILVALNRHPKAKRILRAYFANPQTAFDRRIETVKLRKGPARGLKMQIDMGSDERHILDGTYEPWIHDVLLRSVQASTVVWDIGAHIGYYLLVASILAPNVSHVAVEPGPKVLPRLLENLKLNGVSGIEVLPVAISDHRGTATFDTQQNDFVSRLASGGSFQVQTVLLDSLLEGRQAPNLVLMDIEGGEAAALRGALRLLDDVKPVWLMELHGEAGAEAHDILLAHGYRARLAMEKVPIREQLTYQRVHALYKADSSSPGG